MTVKDALRDIDLPPLWLAAFAAVVWITGSVVPLALPYTHPVGYVLVLAGVVLTLVAAGQMVLMRTTVIPRREPCRLVTSGVFAVSRNPIYLADAMILAGLILVWDAALAAPLVPAFMALITRRYIRGEEVAIATLFGPEYQAYRARVRRWL
ncbi:methyltransferase family protein [Rhodobacter capsulatus]|uniref:methyltransferase family protein n=1 Tax=Rhodobacter capsulatus TaxID=1061 RepID=UPI004027F149